MVDVSAFTHNLSGFLFFAAPTGAQPQLLQLAVQVRAFQPGPVGNPRHVAVFALQVMLEV